MRQRRKDTEFIISNYGKMTQKEMAEKLNRSTRFVSEIFIKFDLKNKYKKEYAIYFDDEYQFTGNLEECMEFLNVKEMTFRSYLTKSKVKQNGIFIVDLGVWRVDE